jgi:glycosyltransferase involved in cell wall biosynthesis
MTESTLGAPFVSVVTPFHNTDEYLEESIRSVLDQDYTNFEYILVDNMSTDRSGEIADKYATLDDRIRVFRTPELYGQMKNYNFALGHIGPDSKYTKMCSADDYIHPRCISEMVALAETDERVAIVSSYSHMGAELLGIGLPPEVTVMSGQAAGRAYFLNNLFLFGSPTTVMYRSDVVREKRPFFREAVLHADTELCFEVLEDSYFGFVHQVLSYLRTQDDSISGRSRDMLPRYLDRVVIVTRHGRRYLDDAEYRSCVAAADSDYYSALARRWLLRWADPLPEDFWDYQRQGLESVGRQLDRGRVARHVAAEVAQSAFSPVDTVRRLRRRGVDGGPDFSSSGES